MMHYSGLISEAKARQAADTLQNYCLQNGCIYCRFYDHGGQKCKLTGNPREWDSRPDLGGIQHA